MQDFSRLDIEAKNAQKQLDRKMEFSQASAFHHKQLTPRLRNKRLKLQKDDFGFFRDTYFPPEVHTQGYYEPGVLQEDIPDIVLLPGMHIVLGPRDYAKTVTLIKAYIWKWLNGKTWYAGTYSENLDKARALITSIATIIKSNPRINADWDIKIEAQNENEFRFKVKGLKKPVSIKPYSLERSVRGRATGF